MVQISSEVSWNFSWWLHPNTHVSRNISGYISLRSKSFGQLGLIPGNIFCVYSKQTTFIHPGCFQFRPGVSWGLVVGQDFFHGATPGEASLALRPRCQFILVKVGSIVIKIDFWTQPVWIEGLRWDWSVKRVGICTFFSYQPLDLVIWFTGKRISFSLGQLRLQHIIF